MVAVKKLFYLFFFISTVGLAQQVRLTARTDSSTYRLGSWIDVHVQGALDASVVAIVPAAKDSIGQFEVINIERKGVEAQWLIRVTSIDSGKIILPPIEFGYKVQGDTSIRKAFTNFLLLTLTGVAIDPRGEIKDIKPPMSAPWLFEDYLPYLIALVVLLIIGAGYYYYRRNMKKKDIQADIKVVIPPHKEALAALHALEEKRLWQQGKVKQYYSEVTEIIRRFFERRWSIIALELTTYEILLQMKHIPEALKVWNEMETFFTTADLVKFAKYVPSPAEHENEMRTAYEIVRMMMPKVPIEQTSKTQEAEVNVR